ncbi:MAG: hypothetical protein LC114_05880 [Bryobacterales bacterium]|nr:hypothetical protein [Bryobacterales bacterium]
MVAPKLIRLLYGPGNGAVRPFRRQVQLNASYERLLLQHHEYPNGLPTGSRTTVDAGTTIPAMWAAVAVNQISS